MTTRNALIVGATGLGYRPSWDDDYRFQSEVIHESGVTKATKAVVLMHVLQNNLRSKTAYLFL